MTLTKRGTQHDKRESDPNAAAREQSRAGFEPKSSQCADSSRRQARDSQCHDSHDYRSTEASYPRFDVRDDRTTRLLRDLSGDTKQDPRQDDFADILTSRDNPAIRRSAIDTRRDRDDANRGVPSATGQRCKTVVCFTWYMANDIMTCRHAVPSSHSPIEKAANRASDSWPERNLTLPETAGVARGGHIKRNYLRGASAAQ